MKKESEIKKRIKKVLLPDVGIKTVYSIIVLRVIAACLITNTHYNNVYPSDKFAVGGLLGDVLFFAVSGFCFAKGIKASFGDWYFKRWKRIYPAVVSVALVYLLTGFWSISGTSLYDICSYFILPTNFLFFGAIMILYIPMYFCVNQRRNIVLWGVAWAISYLLFYIFILDKSAYRINEVSNPSVLFLYFGAILIGVTIGRRQTAFFNHQVVRVLLMVISTAGYFAVTVIVRASKDLYSIQISVALSLLALCFSIVNCAIGLEKSFQSMPNRIIKALSFIANLTLEIYVVQLIIIRYLSPIVFPLNWFLITATIVVSAMVLKLLISLIISGLSFAWKRIQNDYISA